MTEVEQDYTTEQLAKIRILRRVAIGVASLVALIFMGAGVLGYYHYRYDRPAKYFFTDEAVPQGVPQ